MMRLASTGHERRCVARSGIVIGGFDVADLAGCAWLAGMALGLGSDGRWWPLTAWVGAASLALAVLYPEWRRVLLAGLALLVTLWLGSWRAGLLRYDPADLPTGVIEAVRGRVTDWPARGDRGDVAVVAIEEVRIAGVWRGELR